MNIFVFILYWFFCFLTILLMTILIKYWKEKEQHKHYVRHQILIDLAYSTTAYVLVMALPPIIRKIVGPFSNVTTVEAVLFLLQVAFDLVLACIVSLQLSQVLTVFCSAQMNEVDEKMQVTIHRIFVIVLGMSSSLFTCSMKAGLCRPVSMYHYLLQDLLKTPPFSKSILQPIKLIMFMMVIGVSQSAIEIKRFIVNREEEKADKLAAAALRFVNSYNLLNSYAN